MKVENNFTVYETNDPCDLEGYSKAHAEEANNRFIVIEDKTNNIEKEQQIQNNKIETNALNTEMLQQENKRLQKLLEEEKIRNDMQESIMLSNTANGTNIHITDSTDYYFKRLNTLGNLKEERYWSEKLKK